MQQAGLSWLHPNLRIAVFFFVVHYLQTVVVTLHRDPHSILSLHNRYTSVSRFAVDDRRIRSYFSLTNSIQTPSNSPVGQKESAHCRGVSVTVGVSRWLFFVTRAWVRGKEKDLHQQHIVEFQTVRHRRVSRQSERGRETRRGRGARKASARVPTSCLSVLLACPYGTVDGLPFPNLPLSVCLRKPQSVVHFAFAASTTVRIVSSSFSRSPQQKSRRIPTSSIRRLSSLSSLSVIPQ